MRVQITIKEHFKDEVEFELDRPEVDSRGFRIHSRAKICPYCLQVWAEIYVLGDDVFGIESQACDTCPPCAWPSVVPGSLLDDRVNWTIDMGLLDYLPPELVYREYQLHIQEFERQRTNEQSTTGSSSFYPPTESLGGSKCTA